MDATLITVGLAAAAVGIVLIVNALRRPVIDAGAVLAELDTDPNLLDEFTARLREPVINRLLRPMARTMAEGIGGLLPRQRADRVRHKLLVAGVSAKLGPEEFVVLQGLGLGGGVLLGLLLSRLQGYHGFGLLRIVALLGAIGLFAPVGWLSRKHDERQGSIKRDLPDVLDLLAISVEAGVGFEGAMEVVTRHFDSPLATEFGRTLQEMELGLPRREALQNLKRRTEVPELSNFVLILVQADALGMPIGRVLRTQAVEMRLKRRQWAREKAAKLPVKILIPLMMCILPALFVVILGPAAMSISKTL